MLLHLSARDDAVVLRLALERAQQNGWQRGRTVLRTMAFGYPIDEAAVARELCRSEEFARAFWSEQTEKHLLGLQLVENPLRYLRLYLE